MNISRENIAEVSKLLLQLTQGVQNLTTKEQNITIKVIDASVNSFPPMHGEEDTLKVYLSNTYTIHQKSR